MARVWREGQLKPVWIYRLLMTGSIEEKVYQRQLSKMGLSRAIVDDSAQQRSFSSDELKSLFKIDNATICDTHNAIKCNCNGSAATMRAKEDEAIERKMRQRDATQGRAEGKDQGQGSASEGEKEAGVKDWAHLRDSSFSPDQVLRDMNFMVAKTITFIMSDHVMDPDIPEEKVEAEVEEEEMEEEGSEGGKENNDENE